MKKLLKYNTSMAPLEYIVSKIDATEEVCGVSVELIPVKRVYRLWRFEIYTKGKLEYYFSPESRFMSRKGKETTVWFRVNKFIKNALIDSKSMKILATLEDSRNKPYLFLNNCQKI